MINLPAIIMPHELLELLKNPSIGGGDTYTLVTEMLNKSPAISLVMERAFSEFNENKIGLDKIINLLGWAHFRERMASVYLFKTIHGTFPDKTDLDEVAEVHEFEERFSKITFSSNSRLYLLGLYVKFININVSMREDKIEMITIPSSLDSLVFSSQIRTDRPDWLILMCWHLDDFLGTDFVIRSIANGRKWNDLYHLLSDSQKFQLTSNLLSYGASIQETDLFLYERI